MDSPESEAGHLSDSPTLSGTSAKQLHTALQHEDDEVEQLREMLVAREKDYDELQRALVKEEQLNNSLLSTLAAMRQARDQKCADEDQGEDEGKTLERDALVRRETIEKLVQEIKELQQRIEGMEAQLEQAEGRERKYKQHLRLAADATEDEVMSKIKSLLEDGPEKMREYQGQRSHMLDIKRQLVVMHRRKEYLESRVKHARHMEETHQQQLKSVAVIGRSVGAVLPPIPHGMSRSKSVSVAMAQRRGTMATTTSSMNPPASTAATNFSTNSNSNSSVKPVEKYCVLCRCKFLTNGKKSSKEKSCSFHPHVFQQGACVCCREKHGQTGGCMSATHCYVERGSAGAYLTDGVSTIQLNTTAS